MKLLVAFVLAGMVASTTTSTTENHRLAVWFGSQTCPALDGLYSKKEPPAVKTGSETLEVDVPMDVLSK